MEDSKVKMDRRSFLKRSTLVAGGVVTATTLQTLTAHTAYANECSPGASGTRGRGVGKAPMGKGYGALKPVADQNGDFILALPDGFQYTTFGKIGDMMSDGYMTPRNHDGMTALPGPNGTIRLIRNHEVRNGPDNFAAGVVGPESTRYDVRGSGGCTTLDYDPVNKRMVRDFISINGTIVNCSGGLAFNDVGWLTSEETVAGPNNGWAKKHGYSFLVRADSDAPVLAVPLTAMGRFAHEAAVADPESGIVYQTEDAGGNSGFYRFLPIDPANLLAGGVLQMAKILRNGYDTRTGQTVNAELPVEWVTIDNPDPDVISSSTSCFAQGFAKGGARWNRLEGIFRGDDGDMYFVSTSGGNALRGQLWRYIPSLTGNGTLVLVFESPNGSVLDSPDNLCVTPSGAILFCEDDASGSDNDTHPLAPGITNINRLIGLGRSGEPFEFAVNISNDSELAGACFSPDGDILFVNTFGDGTAGSGMTCAITGPWRKGAL